jgi:hypothetical protein
MSVRRLVSAEEQSRQPMILLSAHQLCARVDMAWLVDQINSFALETR